MEEMNTLEEMRQQIALLKEKLDNEAIVSDKLLRNSMHQRLGVIRRQQVIEYCGGAYVILFGSFAFYRMGLSMWFIIGTALFMIAAMAVNYYEHREFNRQNLYNDDLLTVAQTMKQLKQRYVRHILWAIPVLLLWACFFGYNLLEVYDAEGACFMIGGMVVGLLVGAFIGVVMFRRSCRACDDIISQIKQ